ncbi:MAG: hypothetical protein O7B99_06385, partial [Planctomycetota bacterium]|nr:hypothetical protein [Planctomycetota bacterium]
MDGNEEHLVRALAEQSESVAPTTRPEIELPLEEGVELQVVHQETGAVVPYADVYFLDMQSIDSDETQLELQAEGANILELMSTFGRRFRADREGRLLVPQIAYPALATGEKGLLWGVVLIDDESESPIRLRVAPDPSLRVRVTDAAGRPVARVPVAMRLKHDGRRDRGPDVSKARTDEEGRVAFSHFRRLI